MVIRRGLALLGLSALLACNAIIGLEQPSTLDGGDDTGEQPDAEQASDAASENVAQGDASLADITSPPFDASGAGDSTVSSDTGPGTTSDSGFAGGDATMSGGPPLLFVVNAAQLPGIVICLGTGQATNGSDTTVGRTTPYPQHNLTPGCIPLTCADLNVLCGLVGDGCGGPLNCGACSPPETCGGGGAPGQCGGLPEGGTCQPLTCSQQGVSCGPVGDGCGSLIQCGTCTSGLVCTDGTCAVPTIGGGLLPGTGQPGPAMNLYTNVVSTAFLIPAWRLTSMPMATCDTLIGTSGEGGALQPGEFYRAAGSAKSGTFIPGTTTLVAFMGCPPGIGDPVVCGDAFDLDAGNLIALTFTQPSAEPVNPGAIQAQSVDLAPALDCSDSGCAASSISLLWPGNMGGWSLGVYDISMPLTMNGFAQDASTVILQNPMHAPTQLSFDDIARASNGGSTTTVGGAAYFASGQPYYLVVVGDPNVSPDASPNGSLHVIGAPLSFQPDTRP